MFIYHILLGILKLRVPCRIPKKSPALVRDKRPQAELGEPPHVNLDSRRWIGAMELHLGSEARIGSETAVGLVNLAP